MFKIKFQERISPYSYHCVDGFDTLSDARKYMIDRLLTYQKIVGGVCSYGRMNGDVFKTSGKMELLCFTAEIVKDN